MIDAYVWTTPNGYKLLIALEELGLDYQTHWVDLYKGEQLKPAFGAINPNHKIPALVDHVPGGAVTVFESGAILTYLGERTGELWPSGGAARVTAHAWMYFGAASVGPMTGQLEHFTKHAKEKIAYAIQRYTKEVYRIHGVLDARLAESPYVAGETYSLVDVMIYPWVRVAQESGFTLEKVPHLKRWAEEIAKRPAVERAYAMEAPQKEKAEAPEAEAGAEPKADAKTAAAPQPDAEPKAEAAPLAEAEPQPEAAPPTDARAEAAPPEDARAAPAPPAGARAEPAPPADARAEPAPDQPAPEDVKAALDTSV